MKNQLSMSSSSSSTHKHDQKLRSATMNSPEQKSPQEIVSERTILEMPIFRLDVVRMERDNVKIYPPKDRKNYICNFCQRGFPNRYALAGHLTSHKKDRESEKQRKMIDSMLSDYTYLVPFDSYEGLSFGPFKYGSGGGSSSSSAYPFSNGGGATEMKTTMFPPPTLDRFLTGNTSYSTSSRYPLPCNNYSSHALSTDNINLDLTLGPSQSIGGSNDSINDNTNSSFDGEVTRGTTNLITPVRPRVSRYNFVAGNPLDSITRYIPPFRNTNLCHDLFSLQENGMGSSHAKSLISMEKNKFMVPPFAPPLYRTTHLCNDLFSLQENGSGPSHSKTLISKGENKFMVPEDDDKDIGMIRWLTKKKRSRRGS